MYTHPVCKYTIVLLVYVYILLEYCVCPCSLISFSSHCSLVESLASGHHCHTETASSYQQQKASESRVVDRRSFIPRLKEQKGGSGKHGSEPHTHRSTQLLYYNVSTSDKNTIELLTTFRSVPAYKVHCYISS